MRFRFCLMVCFSATWYFFVGGRARVAGLHALSTGKYDGSEKQLRM